MIRRNWQAAMLLALGLLTGCVHQSSVPSLHRLDSGSPELPPQSQETGKGRALLLGPLQVADYLQREVIVQREGDGSYSLSNQGRWAGSLQADVARVLLQRLAAGLQSSRVSLYPDREGLEQPAQLLLDITRFDAGREQPAVLEARWRLLDHDGRLNGSHLLRLQQEHDGSLAGQIAAQSLLLQQMADSLLPLIQALPQPAPPRRVKQPARRKASTAPALPQMPSVPPQGPPVYRF